ncbi:integrase catalytic domain-containing protein [Trichonephila clavipes]|nr:integrase catalytic domain-containing protein [Trichonephila clavipes]
MNQGILFRYSSTSESEEAQLVVPIHERQDILKIQHDAPNAGHYGADGTFERNSKRYYWTGMRSYITDYVKNCQNAIVTNHPTKSLPDSYVHLCILNVLRQFPLISSDLCLKVHPERSGYLLLRTVVQDGAKCDTTGKTDTYLQFGREMRTIDDVTNAFRAIIDNENFVPEITPYLKRLARISSEVRERIEEKQDQRKTRACQCPLAQTAYYLYKD